MTHENGRARWAAAMLLALLVAASSRLAATRIYQVDECYTVAMARLVAERRTDGFQSDPSLLPVALAAASGGVGSSRDLFARARRTTLALFWVNLLLLAACAGARAGTGRWLGVLLAAATLAPLWEYGFEVRHDVLLLTVLLLTWLLLRGRPRGRLSYFAAGALAVAAQFVAFKAFVFVLPLSAAFLAFPPPSHRASRTALVAAWLAGVVTAAAALRAAYGAWGLWPAFVADLHRMTAATEGVRRMYPIEAFARFLAESPLLFAGTCAALTLAVREWRRRGAAAWSWDGCLPEAGAAAGAVALLFVNPRPYAYDLVFVLPFAFLAVHRRWGARAAESWTRAGRLPTVWALALVVHTVPFAAVVAWDAGWTNARQGELSDAAEALTAPRDPVFDGVGLVPTRPHATYHWLLDTLNIRPFVDGSGETAREQLTRTPAPVIVPNYRTDWLTAQDHAFVESRYRPLADDFWVLGAELPPGGGEFVAVRAGRYRLEGVRTVDDSPATDGPLALAEGPHRLRADGSRRPTVTWLGPRLDVPPRLSSRSHRLLFIDWY